MKRKRAIVRMVGKFSEEERECILASVKALKRKVGEYPSEPPMVTREVFETADWIDREGKYKRIVSHTAAEGALVKFLVSKGWQQIPTKTFGANGLHLPDRAFSRGDAILLAEVKPGTAGWVEIKKGLGQTLCLLGCQKGIPVLVCSDIWKDNLLIALEPLGTSIWLLLFRSDKSFVPIIGDLS